MAKKYKELRAKMRPKARAEAHRRAQEILAAMPLQNLRRAREFTRQVLAEVKETTPEEILHLERHTDIYISTVRSYVEALNGSDEKPPEGAVPSE